MKTIFKVGMTVYDNIFFPNSKGEVVRIDKHIDCERVFVQFDCLDYELSYTTDGRYYTDIKPTLATKPYTLQGFEQKAPAPTYEEALVKAKTNFNGYPSYELAMAAEALQKLLFLRDYYNEGWQPDWTNDKWKYFIEYYRDEFCINRSCGYSRVLAFKSKEIIDKFLEEQKKLLEIAKPLL